MDSAILKRCLEEINRRTFNRHSVGVYSADRLPSRITKPAAIIAHSEQSSVPTGHWFAMYIPEKGPACYFDSYGQEPYIKTHINFLKRIGGSYSFNRKPYQQLTSTTCGGYCLLFLASKLGYIKKIKRFLGNDKFRNDKFVAEATMALIDNLEA
jgi:hypothetical protein